MNAQTGGILYSASPTEQRYPASLTKVMTALLVLEHVSDLYETLRFPEYIIDTLPTYASDMDMTAADTLTILEALYGIMLTSANEVARALAVHVSGSMEGFVAVMNRRAQEIGAVNTHFINPCGLPGEGQRTTAHDMALIMQEALRHPLFTQIIATPTFDAPPSYEHPLGREIRNTNHLIHRDTDFFNPTVVGGKTGFTRAAGHTLVTYSRVDGQPLITAVLYAPERRAIFTDTTALLTFISFVSN
jgi:D-alanyl-D-alanine carboxypeptidase